MMVGDDDASETQAADELTDSAANESRTTCWCLGVSGQPLIDWGEISLADWYFDAEMIRIPLPTMRL